MAQGPWPDESAPPFVRPVRPTQFAQQERRLDLQEVLSVLWFRKWSILAITLLTVAVALLVSSRQTPIYVSQAGVLVTPIDTGSQTATPEPLNLATEAELISSVVVAEIVADNLNIEDDPRDLDGHRDPRGQLSRSGSRQGSSPGHWIRRGLPPVP